MEGSDSNSKKSGDLWCERCQVQCSSRKDLKGHLKGKRHKNARSSGEQTEDGTRKTKPVNQKTTGKFETCEARKSQAENAQEKHTQNRTRMPRKPIRWEEGSDLQRNSTRNGPKNDRENSGIRSQWEPERDALLSSPPNFPPLMGFNPRIPPPPPHMRMPPPMFRGRPPPPFVLGYGRGMFDPSMHVRMGRGSFGPRVPYFVPRYPGPPIFTNTGESPTEGDQVDINNLRSTISKKADLATPCSTDNVDAKTKSTLDFSAKTSKIIDDVLMGRAPTVRGAAKHAETVTSSKPAPKSDGTKKGSTDAKNKLLKTAKDGVPKKFTNSERQTAQIDLTGDGHSVEGSDGRPSSSMQKQKGSGNESVQAENRSCVSTSNTPQQSRSRRSSATVTRSPGRSSSTEDQRLTFPMSDSPRKNKEMTQEDWRKLVTAPRSRKEQLLIEKLVKDYSKRKHAARLKSAALSDQQAAADITEEELSVQDLPDEIQIQIAQLLQEEVHNDLGLDVMDITPVVDYQNNTNVVDYQNNTNVVDYQNNTNVVDYQNNTNVVSSDCEEDLESVMFFDCQSESHSSTALNQDAASTTHSSVIPSIDTEVKSDGDPDCPVHGQPDEQPHSLLPLQIVPLDEYDGDNDQVSSQAGGTKRRRSFDEDEATQRQFDSGSPDAEREMEMVSKKPKLQDFEEEAKEAKTAGQPGGPLGTGFAEELLEMSLKEEQIRHEINQKDDKIHEHETELTRIQNLLDAEKRQREELYRQEAELRAARMNILKGAVSGGAPRSQQASAFHEVYIEPITIVPQSSDFMEPDTTTSSPPELSFPGFSTEQQEHSANSTERPNSQSEISTAPFLTDIAARSRGLSQCSADLSSESGGGEYTVQYMGSLEPEKVSEAIKQLTSVAEQFTGVHGQPSYTIPDTQQPSVLFVNEQVIEGEESPSIGAGLGERPVNNTQVTRTNRMKHKEIEVIEISEEEHKDHRPKKKKKKRKSIKKMMSRDPKLRHCSVSLTKLIREVDECLSIGCPMIVEDELDTVESTDDDTPLIHRRRKRVSKQKDWTDLKTQMTILTDSDFCEEETAVPVGLLTPGLVQQNNSKEKVSLDCFVVPVSNQNDIVENLDDLVSPERLVNRPQALRPSALSSTSVSGESSEGIVGATPRKQKVTKYEGHTSRIHCIQVHEGKLYTGSEDHTAMKFDFETGVCEAVYKEHCKGVQCLAIVQLPNAAPVLATGSFDCAVFAFDTETNTLKSKMFLPSRVLCMCEHRQKLYVGTSEGIIFKVNAETMKTEDEIIEGRDGVRCIATGREGGRDLLVTGSVDGNISIRDMHNGLLIRSINSHRKIPLNIQVVHDMLYSASADHTVKIHNLNTGDYVNSLEHRGVVTSVQVHGGCIYTAGYEGLIRCFDAQTLEKEKVYYGAGKGWITSMRIHENCIISGSMKGAVESVKMSSEKWNCRFGRCARAFGLRDHLKLHVVRDHIITSQNVLRCLWVDCDQYLHVQDQREETIAHVVRHVKEGSSSV